MKHNKKPKTQRNLLNHSIRRFEERYNSPLPEYLLLDWNKAIHKQSTSIMFLGKESLTREYYLIDNKYYAVYNKRLNGICTFLTKEMMNQALKSIGLSLEILIPDLLNQNANLNQLNVYN